MTQSNSFRGFGLLLCLAALTLPASTALGQGGGSVRYSYEQVEINGSPSWVLLPRGEKKLGTKGKAPSKGAVIGAFDLLKSKKRSSYGNASIKIGGGKWPQKAAVTVTIDPKFANYAPIVIAETVYTLTEMGVASGVIFSGYGTKPMKRADVPIVTYTLTVPMWQALPPNRVKNAQVMLDSGVVVDSDQFYQRWSKKDAKLTSALYGFLKSNNASTVISVLRVLPKLKLPYQDKIKPLVSHPMPLVRREAVAALAPFKKDAAVLDVVAKQLATEKDATTAKGMGAFLRSSGNKEFAVLEPVYFLNNGTEAQAVASAASLTGYSKSPVAKAALVGALGSKNEKVAAASATALVKMGAEKELLASLENKKVSKDQRLAIAKALTQVKTSSTKIKGLGYVASEADERSALKAISQLTSIKEPAARTTLVRFLSVKDQAKQIAAANALAKRAEVESLVSLAKASGQKGAPSEVEAAGFAVMMNQPMNTILDYTRNKNSQVKQLAYRALGEKSAKKKKASRSVMDTLKQGTTNKSADIRGASARALGSFATKDAAKTLGQMGSDKSAQVRRDVALALANFKNGEQADLLVKMLDDKNNEVIAASIYAMGQRKEAASWNKIKSYTKSKDADVRASALQTLSQLVSRGDKQGVTEVISILSGAMSDRDMKVQQHAVKQLGTFNSENAVLSIAAKLNAKELPLRVEAVRALGNTGNKSAKSLLIRALNDPEIKVREAAILALGQLGDKTARTDLQQYAAKEKDAELKALANDVLKKL